MGRGVKGSRVKRQKITAGFKVPRGQGVKGKKFKRE
jgi:hypothetical protein